MTEAPVVAPASSSWLARGATPTPWVHAAVAGAIAGVASALIWVSWLGFLFAGWAGVVALGAFGIGGMVLAFIAAARFFVERGFAWFGLTVLPWAGVTSVTLIATASGSSTGPLWPTLFGFATAAGCTLLGHRGPPRVVGIALLIAVASAMQPLWVAGRIATAQALHDSTVRPYLTEVDMYYSWGEAQRTQTGPEAYAAEYFHGEWAYDQPMEPGFLMTTERVGDPAHSEAAPCDTVIHPAAGQYAEAALTCREVDGRWIREGETTHEVFMIVGDLVIRAASSTETPLDDLHAALDAAAPMDDAHYRYLLLGPEYGCLPGYDCPVDEP